ncbi:MAG: site-specific integrase [Firmicutes bacterium]|nr:site-specific integrase [Bacillota bacterium]
MTYKGKTIQRHIRGNWFVRVHYRGKTVSIYGRTQIDCYNKLKLFVEKIEVDKAQRVLQRLEVLAMPQAQPLPKAQAKKTGYTLKEWFDEWLGSYKVGNVRQATIDSFLKAFSYLEKLHNVNIQEITSLMLSKVINSTVGARSKDKIHNLCRQMFLIAFNNRIVESNPTLIIPRPKQYAKFEKKAFTPEQEKKFIDLCLANLNKYEPLLICLLQGIRKGELLALRPNDLDFKQNTLRIDESYDQNYPDDLETKNAASKRTMPMFGMIRQILLKFKDCDPDKRIYEINGATLGKRLEKLLKDNDLPRMTLHELRHTFITRCHEKVIDELIIQKWVGHAKGSRMTKAVYTHINNETELKSIELLNASNY